jgi:neutral amino acid transport system ATP-binding protein
MTGPILVASSVCKAFGGVVAVNNASLSIEAGKITSLIGPNGAGKTTMFNLVSGFMRPDKGEIRFEGRRIDRLRGDVIARAGLVRTFQTPRMLTRMSVLSNMLLAAQDHPGERFFGRFLSPGEVRRFEDEARQRAFELLDLIRLRPLADEYAGNLSGGQRKLLDFGRALMVRPRLLLLDEPMAGVAPPLAAQLLDHILELNTKRKTTVLIVEHDMDMVMSVSDTVIVMDEGQVIAVGMPEEVQRHERVIEAYLGRAAVSNLDEPGE